MINRRHQLANSFPCFLSLRLSSLRLSSASETRKTNLWFAVLRIYTLIVIGVSGLLNTTLVTAAQPQGTDLHRLTSYSCGSSGCHADIFRQWNKSMHANSVPMKDPIHAAFYRQLVGDPLREGLTMGDQFPVCLQCHAPFAALDGRTNLNAKPTYYDGINCMICHTFEDYKGRTGTGSGLPGGIHDYSLSPHLLQGSGGRYFSHRPDQRQGAAAKTYHPYPVNPNQTLLKTSKACIGCHDMRDSAEQAVFAEDQIACQSCHMPKIDGIADHSMLGGHSDGMVQQALLMSIEAENDGQALRTRIILKNTLPHGFPATMPLRNVTIKVTAYAENGRIIWENYRNNAAKEDPKAVLMYKPDGYIGHPPLPVTAMQGLADSHLKAKEKRILEYSLPQQNIQLIRAEALYQLLLPDQVIDTQPRYARPIPQHLVMGAKQARTAGVAELRF